MTSVATAVDWHEAIAQSFDEGYARSPAFIERLGVWQRAIAAYVKPGDRVLDAGCGSGVFSFEAAARGASVEGFDGSEAMIAICRQRQAERKQDNVRFDVAMLSALREREGGAFDVVLSSSVLEYLPDLEGELGELVRMLAPGGTLIVSMPNADGLYRKVEKLAYALTGRPRYYAHVRSLAHEAGLRRTFDALGLETLETRFYADPPLPPFVNGLLGGGKRRKTLLMAVARRPGRS